MDEINENENLELAKKAKALGLAFNKKRIIFKTIYLSIVFVIVIGLAVTIILLFKDGNIDLVRNAAIIATVVICFVCFFTSDWIVCNFSKSLKTMQDELDQLHRILYPEIFASRARERAIRERSLSDKIKLIIGVSFLVLGIIALITDFIITDIISTEIFFVILLSGIWFVIYSFFVMLSKRLIRGMYYPTMTLLTVAAPPLLTAWLTQNAQEWVMILSTCLATAFGISLFAIFMYFAVYHPEKERRKFVKDNKDLFEEREPEQEGFRIEIINAKGDRALISDWRGTKHHLIIEKRLNDEMPHFTKHIELEFVEYHNAYYAAVKEIVGLYKAEDGRTEFELEQRARRLMESNINAVYEKLQKYDYLKDKISIHAGEVISIEFHKYFEIRLSDDMCEYFNTHWYPASNEDSFEFLEDLINERVVFYQNRLTHRRRQYDGIYLDKLLKTKNKKFCRVYSAMKIYIDK